MQIKLRRLDDDQYRAVPLARLNPRAVDSFIDALKENGVYCITSDEYEFPTAFNFVLNEDEGEAYLEIIVGKD